MQHAISYRRFSTARQAMGDSTRRQGDLAEEYCERHGLKLVDTYLDAGLSGFSGEHIADNGALKALLDQAKAGRFRRGTLLIVESLDRLSRLEMSTALRLFLDILDMGLVIVTLIDGEQVFTKERVDGDPTALMFALIILSRANNQSKINSERSLQGWQAARRRAREHKIPVSILCPAWLHVVGPKRSRRYLVNEERARVVGLIYKLAVSGMGHKMITEYLNEEGISPFGRTTKWRSGSISNILTNRAVIGTYEPTLSSMVEGRRERIPDPDGPIENYYPPVISNELYNEYRLAVQKRMPYLHQPKGHPNVNLIARLGRCALCGDTLNLTRNSNGHDYLRCSSARQKQCENIMSFPYHVLEPTLLVLDDTLEIVSQLAPKDEAERVIDKRILQLKEAIFRAKARLAANPSADEQPVNPKIAQQRGRIVRLEDQLLDAEAEAYSAKAERATPLARYKTAKGRAQALDAAERHGGRGELIAALRELLDGVVLHEYRNLTIHSKLDGFGFQVVCALSTIGLEGIRVKRAGGKAGFIGASIFRGMMRSVWRTRRGEDGRTDKPLWQSVDLGGLVRRVQVVELPNGDWRAMVNQDERIDDIVAAGEYALNFVPRSVRTTGTTPIDRVHS
jgi:DNA invertase Pin-like site-specific DNA recombinase